MGSDTSFKRYAAALVGAVLKMLTAVVLAGIASVPTPLFVVEHVGLGLLFRASYKSLAGPGWAFGAPEVDEVVEAPHGAMVGAAG